MSVVTLGKDDPRLSVAEINGIAAKAGLTIPDAHKSDFQLLLGALDQSVRTHLLTTDGEDGQDGWRDYLPRVDFELYPRTDVRVPDDAVTSDKGGWATKCVARCTVPSSSLLEGMTVALKDNVALAGVRCTNGTTAVAWTPSVDATVAARIMDAGAVVLGKATCENACMEGVSDTSCTGPVHNPFADGYSAGGSSSGSGRLVATGSVDVAIGCDQGGSIRIPAANCGLVGLKPTWGLVPYTGILSLEATIDHAGPMAKNVRDAALLLQAIAGPDGIDDRQPPYLPPGTLDYVSGLDSFLSSDTELANPPLSEIKIGLLEEGFAIPGMDSNIETLCRNACSKLKDLGADIVSISIPSHSTAAIIWMCSIPVAGSRQGLLCDLTGRKQLYMTDRIEAGSGPQLSQKEFDALGPGAQNLYMRYLYLFDKYGAGLHARCSNALRKINDDYDRALKTVDVLVMPTLPQPPCELFDNPAAHGPLERLSRNVGLVGNTAPFNSTGHPALTIPVGFVPAAKDPSVKLPAGLQIVGKKFGDFGCLKVGAAWEKAYDWKQQSN